MDQRIIQEGNSNAIRIAKELGLTLGVPEQEDEDLPKYFLPAEKLPKIPKPSESIVESLVEQLNPHPLA
jgi:hypothetical protein